jgi:hypothetical protein
VLEFDHTNADTAGVLRPMLGVPCISGCGLVSVSGRRPSGLAAGCLQTKPNFRISSNCFAEFVAFGWNDHKHEDHVRHVRIGVDLDQLRDLFRPLLGCGILLHLRPGSSVSGGRPRAQSRVGGADRPGHDSYQRAGVAGISLRMCELRHTTLPRIDLSCQPFPP